jgi:hypothetical protein
LRIGAAFSVHREPRKSVSYARPTITLLSKALKAD